MDNQERGVLKRFNERGDIYRNVTMPLLGLLYDQLQEPQCSETLREGIGESEAEKLDRFRLREQAERAAHDLP